MDERTRLLNELTRILQQLEQDQLRRLYRILLIWMRE